MAKDVVCELHFPGESVIKEDKTVLFDGSLHVIPCIRYALQDDAVPIVIGNEDVGETINIDDGCVGFADHLLETSSASSTDHDEIHEQVQDCRGPVQQNVNDNHTQQCPDPQETVGLSRNCCSSQKEQSDDNNNVGDNSNGFADHLLKSSSENSFPENEEGINSDDYADHRDRYRDDSSVVTYSMYSDSVCSSNQDNINTETLKTRLHLILHNDLSVTARTPDSKVGLELQGIVSSVQKLETLLKDASGQLICSSSGFENGRRAENCAGLIRCGQYKNLVQEPRCPPCRHFRKTLLNRYNRRKSNPEVRYARSKHTSQLKQRRYLRFKKKNEHLVQEILQAHRHCAAVSENAVNDAISALPLVQQEAVHACLNAAKVKCSNQRRYTLDWVYECLLMRIKNSKLYEHLRSRNILQIRTP